MRVLIVDDEPGIRQTFSEFALAAGYDPIVAKDGLEALEILKKGDQIAVIISDLKMPNMSGIDLLNHVKVLSPNTTRVMLTAFADLETAIHSVNEGHIFRFLTKPISRATFLNTVKAGIDQHRLLVGEKELLEKTLRGSILIMTELLGMVDKETFGFVTQLRNRAKKLAMILGVQDVWQIELAAVLSQIGIVTVPAAITAKLHRNEDLTDSERQIVRKIPEVGFQLISHIPRLETVAEIVRFIGKNFDGTGLPDIPRAGFDLPQGSRLLRILADLSLLEEIGIPYVKAVEMMQQKKGVYDEAMLNAIVRNQNGFWDDETGDSANVIEVLPQNLQVDDVLVSDIRTTDGKLILKAGSALTILMLEKIENYSQECGLKLPIIVRRPTVSGSDAAR